MTSISRNSPNPHRKIITMCASCHSVKINTRWMPYPDAKLVMDIPKLSLEMRISHGLCESCAAKLYGSAVIRFNDQKE